MPDTKPILAGPADVARVLADRSKTLRLVRGWTQATLAHRAGATTASYRRFETSGKASLELFLKVAHALGRLDEFTDFLKPPSASSIDELARQSSTSTFRGRKRGVR